AAVDAVLDQIDELTQSPFDRNPDLEPTGAVYRVELGTVALEHGRVGRPVPGLRQPPAPDRRKHPADRGDVLALLEYGVSVRRHSQRDEFRGYVGEIAHFDSGKVIKVTFFVGVVAGAVGGLAHLVRHMAEVR